MKFFQMLLYSIHTATNFKTEVDSERKKQIDSFLMSIGLVWYFENYFLRTLNGSSTGEIFRLLNADLKKKKLSDSQWKYLCCVH